MFEWLSLKSGVFALLGVIVAWLGKTYLAPLLEVEKHRRYAQWIAQLADEITDDLVRRYPANRFLEFVDQAVDKLMEVCNIEREVARRAINSALQKKLATR
jgi:hypothetical protein